MGANKRLNWLSAAFSGMGLDGGMNLSAVFSGMGLERLSANVVGSLLAFKSVKIKKIWDTS